MFLLYLDESGDADQDYYVLGGISAYETRPYFLSKALDDFQQAVFPGIADPIEFHASAMVNGNGEPWSSMAREKRNNLVLQVYDVLASFGGNVTLFAVAMHKKSFLTSEPVQRTCEEIAGHFDAYLTRQEVEYAKGEKQRGNEKQRGIMVFDESRHAKTLHALLTEFRTTGASFGKVRHMAEIPMFTDSKLTRMLQFADFVAYAVFRRYQRHDAQFLDKILHRFDQTGGKLHGLVHLVSNYRECFCPACLTRR
jgi:hypothetical protein